MKTYLIASIKLTLVLLVLLAGVYPVLVAGIGKLSSGGGGGETVSRNGQVIGFANVGQVFTQDGYFQGRPSAVDYNAAGSGGSNKGPSNPDYLTTVQARIDTFLAHNPGVTRAQIPAELVTASGSGLDPHLSPEAAYLQVARVAQARNLPEQKVRALVQQHVEAPLLGILGPEKVNVLQLNLALDALK
ncbi:K(+)-transporting ATPase subunit C [Rufibacter ruber]|uniref:K(+)-transporting ATPase subunit C n=1 Tax=Rufibacter ruber TaxID=1783499 RepID=UPI00082E5F9D|nr:K(+)-transporting ATPase subunit C [Rufibacter ruber]